MRLGIITGSGTYALPGLEGIETVEQETRFGAVLVSRGSLAGVEIVHISRHGDGHARLSSAVNHRANVLALSAHGVQAVIGATVCGAVDPTIPLGSLIVFDDFHFLTNRLPDGSICTLYDEPGQPGRGHWIFDRPYAPALRAALLEGARANGRPLLDGGCYGHVDGPRFNSRAEISALANCGVVAVSQTAGPETALCGEAELPYALLGYATDYANGVHEELTSVADLERLIAASTPAFAETLSAAIPQIAVAELAPVGTRVRWD